ncbi:hypothetical protein [Mycolicibacterium goodii]|uniref:hypothetical protein n=1 Tax=Mycolicibacterium goodii TaxID=134601 RepID=UPI00296FDDD8
MTTVSAQTNTSTIKPKTETDPAAPVAPTATAAPAPAAPAEAVAVSAQTATPSSSPAPAAGSTSGAEAGTTVAAAESRAASAPAPAVSTMEAPAVPATAPPAPAVATAAPPDLRALVAQLLKMLATSAVEAVEAVVALMMADLRVVFGVPSLGQGVANRHVPNALHPSDSIVVLLKQTLTRSSLSDLSAPTFDRARTSRLGFDELTPVTPVTVMLKSTVPVLADGARHPGSLGLPTPTEQAVTALVAMSIWALLYSALPGLSGLAAAGATGVRIGYRQAKARMTLHDMEFARFVRSGPIGVVRTGSPVLVAARADEAAVRHLKIAS